MAETINLTPPSADWGCYCRRPNGESYLVDSGAIVVTDPQTGKYPLQFYMHPQQYSGGRGHGFKMPPTALTGKVTGFNMRFTNEDDEAVSASIPTDYAFIADDGRLVFRKGLIPTVIEAIEQNNVDNNHLNEVQVNINVELRPVYRNPSGPTPAFAPKNALIAYNFTQGFSFVNFENRDLIDEMPYITYAPTTYETPATIGAGPSAV